MKRKYVVEVIIVDLNGNVVGQANRIMSIDPDALKGPMPDTAQNFYSQSVASIGTEAFWAAFPRAT